MPVVLRKFAKIGEIIGLEQAEDKIEEVEHKRRLKWAVEEISTVYLARIRRGKLQKAKSRQKVANKRPPVLCQ